MEDGIGIGQPGQSLPRRSRTVQAAAMGNSTEGIAQGEFRLSKYPNTVRFASYYQKEARRSQGKARASSGSVGGTREVCVTAGREQQAVLSLYPDRPSLGRGF